MSWTEATKGYPCGAHVRALQADGWFVEVGTVGVIVGREFPNYPVFDVLLVEVRWENDTKTTVPCELVERIAHTETGDAA